MYSLNPDVLKFVLTQVQSYAANADRLTMIDRFYGMSAYDAIIASVQELYSPLLLDAINHDLKDIYIADLKTDSVQFSDCIREAESVAQDRLSLGVKLWDKPAVCLGEYADIGGDYGDMIYKYCICTYVDVSGQLFFVEERRYQLSQMSFVMRNVLTETRNRGSYIFPIQVGFGSDFILIASLSNYVNYFPKEYRDFWNI